MARYLDPKSDVVFKKIFGEHPHLLKHFLNAVLPLPDDQHIVSLEYLLPEQTPEIPTFKRTIVDVKCKDEKGKIFIVEMQMEWTDSFMQRLLFGTAQAYVKQLKAGEDYHLLNPVYGLALVDAIFDKKTPDWYHHYGLVKVANPSEEIIKGLTLVFVELPKFKANSKHEKKLKVLWLRFMREITTETETVDEALLAVPEIKEAVALTKKSAYTPQELEAYDSYWKAVSSERTLKAESEAKGRIEGEAKGRIEGEAIGLSKGKMEGKKEIVRFMKSLGKSNEEIISLTGLSHEDIV